MLFGQLLLLIIRFCWVKEVTEPVQVNLRSLVESREQTIRRETKEEVGLQLKNLVFWKDEFDNKMTPVQTWRTYFFIGGGEGKIKLDKGEISEIILINRRNFEELDIAFNHREILEEFFGLR